MPFLHLWSNSWGTHDFYFRYYLMVPIKDLSLQKNHNCPKKLFDNVLILFILTIIFNYYEKSCQMHDNFKPYTLGLKFYVIQYCLDILL